MKSSITTYVENAESSEFYPTPQNVVDKMLSDVDWAKVKTILEPSAGKGDIINGLLRKEYSERLYKFDVDYIEIDNNLRSILKFNFGEAHILELYNERDKITSGRNLEKDWETGKYRYYNGKNYQYYTDAEQQTLTDIENQLKLLSDVDKLHLVHDDFLTFSPLKEYDLIIMNPPFSNGDKHLLKALEIQKHGGGIVCLLNAETIRNPYTETRRTLLGILNKYNAAITYLDGSFIHAERSTAVEVALINVSIPTNDDGISLFEKLAKAKEYSEPTAEESAALEVTDFLKSIINRCRIETEAGIELIRTYRRMQPYLRASVEPKTGLYDGLLIKLVDKSDNEITVNNYVRGVRLKYWKGLLTNPKFVGRLTSKLQQEYQEKVYTFADYDFSEFNIKTLLLEMNAQIKTGVESEIEAMYDRLTEEHAYYPECTKNKHLYNGWKTNKAWKIDKKCILPCYGIFSGWNGKPRTYEAYKCLSDIERVLNFFDGHMTEEVDMQKELDNYFSLGITKNVKCKFFNVTFYKKGTVHIVFTCPELIDRYNIYVAQNRNWLPPSYGKKKYSDMSSEEKSVIDSFQGEEEYNKVFEHPGYYFAEPTVQSNILALESGD